MPIYESTMTYAEMRKASEDGHECAICGGPLSVAWDGKGYILRCQDLSHNKITRHDTKKEERIRQYRMDSTALTKLTQKQMMARVMMGPKFVQDLSPAEQDRLAQLATFYGLDPAMGELTIFQGNPYVSIDGRRRKAQETGQLDGSNGRPATKQEREAEGIPDGDYLWQAEVWKKGCTHPFIGWGRVRASETKGNSNLPVVKDPSGMAEKRAETKALKKGFNIPLPSYEEAGTPDDPNIIESTARVIEDTPTTPTAQKESPEGNGEQNIPATIGELCQWAISNGRQYNGSWVAQQVGERSAADIKDVKNAYLTIKEITGWEDFKKGA